MRRETWIVAHHFFFLCHSRTLDTSRPINDNCGWDHVQTDLTTYHDYADSPELRETCSKLEGGILGGKAGHAMFVGPIRDANGAVVDPGTAHKPGAPVICTEFGGVNIAPAEKEEMGERDWGYTTASDPKDLLERFRNLLMAVVQGGHTCGFVYTQLCVVFVFCLLFFFPLTPPPMNVC